MATDLENTTINYSSQNPNATFTSGVGTPIYNSPEQRKNLNYNQKVDIYALGLVLYEMCSLFVTNSERLDCFKKIKEKKEVKKIVEDNFIQESKLILKMIEDDPDKRPSAEEILKCDEYKELKKINDS